MKIAVAVLASTCTVTALAQPSRSLVDIATTDTRFSTLVTALQATGLDQAVANASDERPLTVFAPTNNAFAKVDPSVLDSLLRSPEKLSEVLKRHVVRGLITADSIVLRKRVSTLVGSIQCPDEPGCVAFGGTISFFSTTTLSRSNTASIVEEGIIASNGIIHAIDSVLLPQ